MNESTRLGFATLATALMIGMLGDGLLRATPWGVNVTLWTSALIVLLLVLAHWGRLPFRGGGRWMLLPVLFFATGFAWRDSPTLKCLDALAILVALALAAFRSRTGQIRRAGLAEYLLALFMGGLNAAFGTFLLLFADIRWREIPRTGWTRQTLAITRGLLIAVPLLLIFGALFVSADAVFERYVHTAFNIDIDTLLSHCILIAFFSWTAAGFLRHTLVREETWSLENQRPPLLSLGIVEIGMTLALLDLLFLCFVLVQVRYFFGGQAHVLATVGLTAADYARRGFFELVTVAALVLPLLLLADWLLRKETPRTEALFRVLAGIQVLLSFVIMVSAAQRMWLYHLGFGLTELRLYTTAFMGWLALVFAWFAWTVLHGYRDRFIFGALVAGFAVIAFLHLLNPDNLIVRANVARIRAGRAFDAGYVTDLSADAVPALVQALPALNVQDRLTITASLRQGWPPRERMDWRTWSYSRGKALAAIRTLRK